LKKTKTSEEIAGTPHSSKFDFSHTILTLASVMKFFVAYRIHQFPS